MMRDPRGFYGQYPTLRHDTQTLTSIGVFSLPRDKIEREEKTCDRSIPHRLVGYSYSR
jgi:hypothetical protein